MHLSDIREVSDHSPGGIPGMNIPRQPWDLERHVLALSTFAGTCVLRNRVLKNGKPQGPRDKWGKGTCSCTDVEIHRSLFDFNHQIVSSSLNNEDKIPKIKVCWNSSNLFEDKLPRDLTDRDDRRYFKDLKTVSEAQRVLFKGTYWFERLIRKNKDGVSGLHGVALLRLLSGMNSYSGKERVDQLCAMKLNHGSVNKLRSILATVDGVVMQLLLSFPDKEEVQNWSKIDQIVHCLITVLLPDYFGENDRKDRVTGYQKLKKLRNAIKERGFNPVASLVGIEVPRELSFYERILSYIADGQRPIDLYRVSILAQNRAMGVPPRSMYLSTLAEIKALLVEPRDPSVYEGIADFIQPSVESIHMKVLDRLGSMSNIERFWTDCLEKAKISLSDSGEFFTNSESGGKLEAARLILSTTDRIPKLDLETGQQIGWLEPSKDPVGECLFHWACFMFSDRKRCYERNLMSVRISLVSELGKYRAITVSHLAHAVLLHVLSHVLLEYLKSVPSSESGVGAANHAWNFFKRLSHKNPNAGFIFGDKDVYVFSTDWEQATNYCDHAVASAMLNWLCVTLGIPKWYRQTCNFALCAPRQVEYIDEESKFLEAFYTTRGELMGDPVVKVLLHYHHLVARESALMQMENCRRHFLKGGVKTAGIFQPKE